jgi:hypothetical protein
MPGQRGISAGRSRGSWAIRIAGIALVVLAAAIVASVLVFNKGTAGARAHPAAPLPTNVVSPPLTVALVNPGPPPQRNSRPGSEMLQESATGLAFAATGGAGQASSQDWTADQMGGGTYIFIYVPDGRCLTAMASPGAPGAAGAAGAALARCNLGLSQRWRHQYLGIDATGQGAWQLSSAADRLCLTAVTPSLGSQPGESGVALRGCGASAAWRQMISFLTIY